MSWVAPRRQRKVAAYAARAKPPQTTAWVGCVKVNNVSASRATAAPSRTSAADTRPDAGRAWERALTVGAFK